MTALLLPWANTDMMNIFLEELSRDFTAFLVIMQVDQAGLAQVQESEYPGEHTPASATATQP